MKRPIYLLLLIGLGVVGCAVGSKNAAPEMEVPCQWHSNCPDSICVDRSLDCFVWWEQLQDPILDWLIGRAAEQNIDMQLAAKRACSGCQDSEESVCSVWINVSTEIARNYIQLRGFQQRLPLIQESIAAQNLAVELTKDLVTRGTTSDVDVIKAEVSLRQLTAEKTLIELSIDKTIYHISVLLGYAPGDLYDCLAVAAPLPRLPGELPLPVPADVLQRRPDVQKAQRQVASASGGRAQEAVYEYQKSVLEALEETEDAISAFRQELERHRYLFEAFKSSAEAYVLTSQLYERGISDRIAVVAAQRERFASEDLYVQSTVDLLLNYVALYKALGGAW